MNIIRIGKENNEYAYRILPSLLSSQLNVKEIDKDKVKFERKIEPIYLVSENVSGLYYKIGNNLKRETVYESEIGKVFDEKV